MRSKQYRTKFIKTLLGASITMAISSSIVSASDLPAKASFSIDDGSAQTGFVLPVAGTGSWFAMEALGPGAWVYTGIVGKDGIILGATQFAEAENVDAIINPSAVTSVDNEWLFFGSNGSHGVSAPGISIVDNTAASAVTLNFSPWYVSYNNNVLISMGGDPVNFPATDDQIASVTCTATCAAGDTFVLNHDAHVPLTSGAFPGTYYKVYIEGTILDLNVDPVLTTPATLDVAISGTNTIDISTLYSDALDVGAEDAIDCSVMVIGGVSTSATQVGSTCEISYTDVPGVDATDSFTVTVGDASGGTSNIATVNVVINDAPVGSNGSMVVNVNDTNTIDLKTLVSDTSTIDWTSLILTNAGNETLSHDDNGVVSYTDNDGAQVANDPFTYTVADSDGAVSVSKTIDVKVNNLPTAGNTTTSLAPLATTQIDLTGLVSDPDSGINCSTFALVAYAGSANITDANNDCIIDYQDTAGVEGPDSFNYTYLDNDGAISNPGQVDVTIVSGNLPPNASGTTVVSQQDGSVDVDINTLAADTDGDALDLTTIAITNVVGGTHSVNTVTGIVTFTPTAGTSGAGIGSFDYTVADDNGVTPKTSSVATVIVDVNAPPVATNGSMVVLLNSSNTIDLSSVVSDSEGMDWTTLILSAGPATDNGNGIVGYVDAGGVSGTDSFTYTVSDNAGGSSSATIDVVINAVPTVSDGVAQIAPLGTITIPLSVADADGTVDCNTLVIGGAGAASVADLGSCNVSYTDAGGVDVVDTFTFSVSDDNGSPSATAATVTVTVNGLPVATTPVAENVNRNSSVDIDVVANVTDADAIDATTVNIVSGVTNGSTSIDPVTGVVTYTPTAGSLTSDSFTFTVDDAVGSTSNVATVNITVNNNLPVAANDSASIDVFTKANIALDVTANDTDADGNLVKATVTITTAATNGSTSIDAITGVVTYTPNPGYIGSDTYKYTIQDNDGDVSVAATVVINVSDSSAIAGLPTDSLLTFSLLPSNISAPVDGDGSWFAMATGDGLIYTPIESFNGIQLGVEQTALGHVGPPNGTERKDIDEPWLFFGNTGLHQTVIKPTVLSDDGLGNATLDFSGWNVSWNNVALIPMGTGAHTGGVNGVAAMDCAVNCAIGDTYIINYYATVPPGDPSGFGGVAYTLHLEGIVTQGLIPTTSPIANNDAAVVAPLGTVTVDLTDNIYDQFSNLNSDIDFTTLTVSYVGTATVVDNNDGTVSYTDTDGINVTDSFSYNVSNTNGENSNTASVSVAVVSGNQPPVASDFSLQVLPAAIGIDVTSAVTDDLNALDLTTVTASQSVNGNGTTSVDAGTGIVTYTPNAGFTGNDSFSYTVKDTTGSTSNLAYVSIYVNGAPVAMDDIATVDRNTSVDIDASFNDTDGDGTLDPSSIVIVTSPLSGGIVFDSVTGLVTYTPNVGYIGTDLFTYTANDNAGATSNEATVNITVRNAVPVAVDDVASINTAVEVSTLIVVLANDTDADGTVDPATVVVNSPPTNGSADVNLVTGSITYTPDPLYVGADTFGYTVKDTEGGVSLEASVVVSVSAGISTMPDNTILTVVPATITSQTIFDVPADGAGSWFSMEVKPGELTHVSIAGFNQLQLGVIQPGSAAAPDIDAPWTFFGNLGVHQTFATPVTILTDNGNGLVTLDMSGWDVSWNSIPSIPMGSGAHTGGVDSVASVTCQAGIDGVADCSEGDSYMLTYYATVPPGDASGFGNVKYTLHLEGEISLVQPCLGGCPADPNSVPYDVTAQSALDDSGAVVTIEPGVTAQANGNTTGFGLTATEIGITDPLLNTNDGQQCIGGCADFVVSNITPAGYIDLVFFLTETIPEGASYRKLIDGVWQNFDESQGDLVGSATAVGGACQGPQGSFEIGLRAGYQCLFLRITDGGPNDTDSLANGTIVDPSGVLLSGSPNTPPGSSSGCSISSTNVDLAERADWILITGFIAWFGLMSYRRKKIVS